MRVLGYFLPELSMSKGTSAGLTARMKSMAFIIIVRNLDASTSERQVWEMPEYSLRRRST